MFDFKFDWCKEMECGVEIIDAQHRELFRIGRDIEQLIMNNCRNVSNQQLLDIVCALRDYASYQLYTEENLMDKYNYPDSSKNKKSINDFKNNVLTIDMKELSKNPKKTLIQLKEYLQTFLFNHILVEDRDLCKYLNSRGVY
ncbi:hemerythrin [Kineothrix alysoides]|jgi:hemerythrin|uniref:Hemerythrin n=1 Tax=Kineothrix alysoides TaxID=1469948 RepID=A0A4R1QSX5_9FIRM|nr:hemerythrin domain-containing protein [Kineothrix alysoides]TCL56948.1 hemerythrin [Kineothrix alysoides]